MIIKVKSMQQNLQRWRVFGSQSTRRICIISANDGGLPVHKLGEYASDAHVSIIAGFTHVLRKAIVAVGEVKKKIDSNIFTKFIKQIQPGERTFLSEKHSG